MLDEGLFDPHSTLRFLVVRYIHACGGVCFGQVVRSFFFHSGEALPRIDCFFPKTEAAEQFLAVLGVEHKPVLKEKRKFGTNSYRVGRSTANGAHCSVEVNIVSYYQGLTRRARLPRNIPNPMFDIDHVYWEKDAVLNTLPNCCAVREKGRNDRVTLSHVLDRCMQRKFAAANPLPRRRPEALLTMLQAAKQMLENGFTMDDDCEARMPVVLKSMVPGLMCAVSMDEIPQESFAVRLPCSHILSFDGIVALVTRETSGDRVCCPVCSAPFCVKDPTVEGIL